MNWHSTKSLQLVVSDLNDIAADAYRHRIRSHGKRGGNGSYDAANGGTCYTLPQRYCENRRARFVVVAVSSNAILLRATSLDDPSCFLTAIVDGRGRLTDISFPGKVHTGHHEAPSYQSHDPQPIRNTPHETRFLKVFEDT